RLGERRDVLPRRAAELDRAQVVVGEHLASILHAAERLEPRRGQALLLGPARARNLAVRDVPHEEVQEGVLRLPLDRGPALAADELLALETVKALLDHESGQTAQRTERARPEHLAEDGGVLHELLLLGR